MQGIKMECFYKAHVMGLFAFLIDWICTEFKAIIINLSIIDSASLISLNRN